MKDLQKYLHGYLKYYQSKCEGYDPSSGCKRAGGCLCKSVAEMWAYSKAIIPEAYVDLSIHNFEGATELNAVCKKGHISEEEHRKLIDLEAQAKQKVWEYCWGYIPYSEHTEDSQSDLDKFSVIASRFRNGTNVVVHGSGYYHDSRNGSLKKVRIQKGKSMLASIILKEAIRRKMFEKYNASTFEYISYPIFRTHLLDKYNDQKQEIMYDLEEMDWLLIDDISIDDASDNYRRFLRSSLDSFLTARFNANKPTIFVMQFDIEKVDIAKEFGSMMEKIIFSKDTFLIKV